MNSELAHFHAGVQVFRKLIFEEEEEEEKNTRQDGCESSGRIVSSPSEIGYGVLQALHYLIALGDVFAVDESYDRTFYLSIR